VSAEPADRDDTVRGEPVPSAGIASSSSPDGVAADLKAALVHLTHHGPPPGRRWCEAWTRVVDQALTRLAAPILDTARLTVAAVGGYGRRELCPASDVDLVLLHDRLPEPALEEAVRAIVYPLWDAGLTVGYAVRNRREAIGAIDELDTATATLDLRTVAGDPGFAQLIRTEAIRRLRRRPDRLLVALGSAQRSTDSLARP
jgi:[protein-PII] uridylyltransferase